MAGSAVYLSWECVGCGWVGGGVMGGEGERVVREMEGGREREKRKRKRESREGNRIENWERKEKE